MLDTLITGGRVVTPAGAGDWDVGIVGEKIVVVAVPGALSQEAARIIDASGKIVLPGGIETATASSFLEKLTRWYCGVPLFKQRWKQPGDLPESLCHVIFGLKPGRKNSTGHGISQGHR
jgi:hypothetical protein